MTTPRYIIDMPTLEVIDARGQVLRRVTYDTPKAIIGRGADVTLVIDNDDQISRKHCEVVLHEGRYILHDLGSRNGTVVGSTRVEAVKLRSGGVFRVGNTLIRFLTSDKPAVQGQPAAANSKTNASASANDASSIYDVAIVDEDAALGRSTTTLSHAEQAARRSNAYGADSLQSLATIGSDPGFALNQLSLINARSQVVHAAGATAASESLLVAQLILYGSMRCKATDIHLEPKQELAILRLRIDGAMIEVCQIPVDLAKKVTSLLKILCDIDIAQRAIIQEGHFTCGVPGRRVDYRVSFTPVMAGQKMVVRVLDTYNAPQTLEGLGLPGDAVQRLIAASESSTGLVTICGPTGSGKTTSLYAILRSIDAQLRNVITIEDPIEYELPGVTQIPVDHDKGHGFAQLLRSCLRQDPDVIVVGEVRDKDTAVTAMQAATTGHLVLSTIHATDSINTVFRLLDLGVEPYLVASTLHLVLAQRLVRVLCPHCKKPMKPDERDLRRLGIETLGNHTLYTGAGCEHCFSTGYNGRTGAFELLIASDELRDVILGSPSIADLKRAAMNAGLVPLREHARQLVLQGITTVDEAHRIVGLE